MVKRIGGLRRKTRSKLTKPLRQKSKLGLTKYFQTFKSGDKAVLKAEPSIQKGIFPMSFFGKTGVIQEKEGSCYKVLIKDNKKSKTLLVHPVHLKKV